MVEAEEQRAPCDLNNWMDHYTAREIGAKFDQTQLESFLQRFEIEAHEGQIAPAGEWRCWMIMAGRGFGKTRAGAEWVRKVIERDGDARIALIGASLHEVRSVMVEGPSGILATSVGAEIPTYEPSLRKLTWPGGAEAYLYSAAEAESLRGPQHSHAWCDELGKWEDGTGQASRCWDNLMLGLRVGERPQAMVTTTPRNTPLVKRILADRASGGTVVTTGSTHDNKRNLPAAFLAAVTKDFDGSVLGRQEVYGELIDEVEGALWTRAGIDACRQKGHGEWTRVVIGVDPPASASGDACGIVVTAMDSAGIAWVLADCSVVRPTPDRWAAAVAGAAKYWKADLVVAEVNQGGDMVEKVLRAADHALPVKQVRATKGKAARAEPVAALYSAGRVRHAGMFGKLEDELCGLMAGGRYEGGGRSPDRADALVWALSELMLGVKVEPRVWAG